MAPSSPRILVCGDVFGHLNQLFKRVQSVNKSSGPFDALLCVGQFFPQSMDDADELAEIIDGKVNVPIPTYFIGNYGAGAAKYLSKIGGLGFKMDGIEICKNLFWLKGSGKFSLHGLLIVYLSGRKMPDVAGLGGYNEDDVDALRALVDDSGIFDIFLTNEWPSGVSYGSNASDVSHVVSDTTGSDSVVAELASELKPRYHFAGTKGVFFAREPYCNGDAAHVTRFVGLAAVGNKDKQKFIHAISPTPASAMSPVEIQSRPPNTTLSPYIIATKSSHTREGNKRPPDNDVNSQYWRYDVSQKRQRQEGADRLCFKFTSTGSCAHGDKCNFRHDDAAREQSSRKVCFDFLNKGKCEKGSDCRFKHSFVEEGNKSNKPRTHGRSSGVKCWFCLSSPDVESHLILSIGEYYYCALAKGPLVQDHVLLVPVEHHPNTISMALESEPELGRYKNALNIYFRNQGNNVIFFEWISRRSLHANIQLGELRWGGISGSVNVPIQWGLSQIPHLLYRKQAVPIPLSKASNALRAFNLAAKTLGFEFTVVSKSNHNNEGRSLLRSTFYGNSNLFYVELPEGIVLSYAPNDKDKFPSQFGREVIAGLLNIADKADWRISKMSKEEESQMAENFKKEFEQFDPAS